MQNLFRQSVVAFLIALGALGLIGCGQQGVQAPPSTPGRPHMATTIASATSARKILAASTTGPSGPCPQSVGFRPMSTCGGPTPDPSPRPSPSPLPSPTELTMHPSNPSPSSWAYIVTTRTRDYYFPKGSTANISSDGKLLVVRGYVQTFNWLLGTVVRFQNYGRPVALNRAAVQSNVNSNLPTASSIAAGGNGCDVSQQSCASCPDCLGGPGNPDGCQYGEDPIVGGCLGVPGIRICFSPTLGDFSYSQCSNGFSFGGTFGGPWPILTGYAIDYTFSPAREHSTLWCGVSSIHSQIYEGLLRRFCWGRRRTRLRLRNSSP